MKFRLVEEQIEYNANPRDKNEGDCTIRALSLAYDMDYNTVKNELGSIGRQNKSAFNTIDTIRSFIGKHGNKRFFSEQNINVNTVEQFANQNRHGVYIVFCSNNPKQASSYHLVTIMNGKIYDTWDSGNYYILEAWEVARNSKNHYKFDIQDYADKLGLQDFTKHGNFAGTANINGNKVNIKVNRNDIEKSPDDIMSIIKNQLIK